MTGYHMLKRNKIVLVLSLLLVGTQANSMSSLRRFSATIAGVTAACGAYCASHVKADQDPNKVLADLHWFTMPKKSPDDLVLSTLLRSTTLYRGSTDWKQKILKSGGKEHTVFNGDAGYGVNGQAKFAMTNHGDKVLVDSEFKTSGVSASLIGPELQVGGINLNIKEGSISLPDTVGKHTRCSYKAQIQRQKNGFEKSLRRAYEYPNCTNPYCTDPGCVRLKQQRFDRDIDLLIYDALKYDTSRFNVTYTANCQSSIPADQIR